MKTIHIDKEKLRGIITKYNIALLVYFGSYARREDFNPVTSDIDISYISDDTLSSDNVYDLLTDLIILHRKSEIDLVNLKTAGGLLKYEIANDGVVLYEKEAGYFTNLQPYLYKSYYETKKFRQIKNEIFQKKLAEELKNVRQRQNL